MSVLSICTSIHSIWFVFHSVKFYVVLLEVFLACLCWMTSLNCSSFPSLDVISKIFLLSPGNFFDDLASLDLIFAMFLSFF